MDERLLFNLEIILVDFFSAYGLTTLLYLILLPFIKNPLLKKLDNQSNRFISFIGIVYLITVSTTTLVLLHILDEESKTHLLQRMFGKYWFGFWIQPLLWVSITQFLRFEVIRKNILLRLLFSLLLILSIEKMVIIFTSFHRDYLPSSWSMSHNPFYPSNFFLELLMKVSIYLLLVGLFFFIKKKITNWKIAKTK